MEYTYEEAYKLIGISRTSFFSRLNLVRTELEKHITKKDGANYITAEGLAILKNYKKMNTEKNEEAEKRIKELNEQIKMQQDKLNETTRINNLLEEHLKERSQNYNFLQEQLLVKDQQIKTLSQLVENSQVLLKQEQAQFKLLANASNTISDEIIEAPEVQKKGLWSRIFKA